MPLTTYPVGDQILKVATSIDIPAVNTPFNPDAINPSITWTWNGMKALEAYGLFGSDFYKAQPPYPTSGGPYINSQTYYLSGGLILTGATTISFAGPSARTYTRGPMGLWSVASIGDYWNPVGLGWQQMGIAASAPEIRYRMHAPTPCTITAASMRVNPAAHGALPVATARMKFDIIVFDPEDPEGTDTTTTVLDTSADVATYDAEHLISASGLSISVPEGYVVVTRVVGESSSDANAVDMGFVWPPSLTITRAKLGEE